MKLMKNITVLSGEDRTYYLNRISKRLRDSYDISLKRIRNRFPEIENHTNAI